MVETASFIPKTETNLRDGRVFGNTLFVDSDDPARFVFHFVLNRTDLFELVKRVSGCGEIGNFTGRIHRTGAGAGDFIDWHDDLTDHRMVGLTVGLGSESYTGGQLRLRFRGQARGTGAFLSRGDAFLFRIGGGWEHKLEHVTSGCRTVGVGWFRSVPQWLESPLSALKLASKLVLKDT